MTPQSVADRPRLHIPDEPVERRARWSDAIGVGADVDDVLFGDDGVAAWLWARWRILERAGIDRTAFTAIAAGYRRELWLWLAGARTWEQCCSGLVGRIDRRVPG